MAGRPAPFWLRDDDAVLPTDALDRLVGLTERYSVPLLLAVIPARTGEDLAARLRRSPHVSVAVHGWAHTNHAPADQKKQELGSHRPAAQVLAELGEGREKLARLNGRHFVSVLVPPWNRIDATLLPQLAGLGFEAISVYGPRKPSPIAMINSNVDLMDWHGTGGCHPHALLIEAIIAQLQLAQDGGDPVGLLAHHLVHDESAWDFLERLFTLCRDCGAEWLPASALLEREPIRSAP